MNMKDIVNFFDNPFFIIMGGLFTLLAISGFIYTLILVIRGVVPILCRLGIALSKGKIAIFASTEYNSLKDMMIDSKIFKVKNIIQINKNDIDKAAKANLFLVHWKEYKDEIRHILSLKKDGISLIVYAPQHEGQIEDESLMLINGKRNSIIVNFRGRLLNDILISLITSYE